MKRSIQALLVLSVSLAATPGAADTTELLERVDRLVAQKKYWTAIKTLNEADRDNLDSDIALEKLDIALDYFAVSVMHEVFGFRDLSKGETIEDIRGESGTYKMVALKPAEMIGRLIDKTPDDFRLHKALGDYYFDVLLRYAGEWTEPDEAIRERCRTYYLAALEHGVSDPQTHYALGYLDLLEGDHDGAASSLERAVAGNPRSANAHYNLAYAYLHLGKPNKALTHAGKSLELYEDRAYRGDAARMIATIHGELQDLDNSLMYYLEADRIDPGNYHTLQGLIPALLLDGRAAKAAAKAGELFALDPTNPTVTDDLIDVYYGGNKGAELTRVFKSLEDQYRDQDEAMGNLLFNHARVHAIEGDAEKAAETMVRARERFGKVLDSDHPVFQVIEEFLAENG
jgi:tetratricopeptide (TPR) repeat protein